MAAAWDGPEGEHWAANAERYEGVGRRLWSRFTEAVPVGRGDHVLDVGCGTGRSARDVARLAPEGEVLGVDLSSAMLERARAAAAREGLANVRFEQADAQVHDFPAAAFDLAISVHGAMFFADPVAAFANIRSALRPGGRLALTAWRELRHNEWLVAVRDALAVGRVLPEPPPGVPGPFALAEEGTVRRVLGEAGFTGVDLAAVEEPMELGATVEDAYAFVSDLGIARGLTHDLDEESRAKAFDALRRTVAEHATPEGVLFGSAAWLITATSP
jgi:SAM-dependent methyltransferase